MNKFFLLTTLILISACSLILDDIQKEYRRDDFILKSDNKKTFCSQEERPAISLVSESESSQENFLLMLKAISKKHSLKFVDKVVLWSLVQMLHRPDQSSPSARLDYFIRIGDNTFYSAYYTAKQDAYPFVKSLQNLLKKHQSQYGLLALTKMIDQYYNSNIYVTKSLANFLKANRQKLQELQHLKEFYIRGDEVLRPTERMSKVKLTELMKSFINSSDVEKRTNQQLFQFKKNDHLSAYCNYDLSLYQNSIFVIHPHIISSNNFGITEGKNAFLATSYQDLSATQELNNTFFFRGQSHQSAPAFCSIRDARRPNKNLWLISTESRDPGQHLYHLLEYGIEDATSFAQLDQILKFSRHLFLKDPVRLIFESARSSGPQLQELLKLDIPIYNAAELGQIWGHLDMKDQSGLILDNRRPGEITCR